MATVYPGSPTTLRVYGDQALTLTADAVSSGNVVTLGQPGSTPGTPVAIDAGATVTIGPFGRTTRYAVSADAGSLSYTITMVPPVTLSDIPDVVAVVGTIGDLCEIIGAGAPVDGTTGATVAGPGSRYTDITAAKLYINGGSKAVPAWKIVTSA